MLALYSNTNHANEKHTVLGKANRWCSWWLLYIYYMLYNICKKACIFTFERCICHDIGFFCRMFWSSETNTVFDITRLLLETLASPARYLTQCKIYFRVNINTSSVLANFANDNFCVSKHGYMYVARNATLVWSWWQCFQTYGMYSCYPHILMLLSYICMVPERTTHMQTPLWLKLLQ